MCCVGDQDHCLCPAGCNCNCGSACPGCGGEDLDTTLTALIEDPDHDETLQAMVDAVVPDETLHDLAGTEDDHDD